MIARVAAVLRRALLPAAFSAAVLLTLSIVVWPAVVTALAVTVSVGGAWIVTGAVVVAEHHDFLEKHAGRLLEGLSFLSSRAERAGLVAELQGSINSGRDTLSGELPDIMPHPARVRFVREPTDLTALKDGEIVISLKDPSRHAENTARAALAYVAADAVRPARPYVAPSVMSAVEYAITKRILRRSDRRALDYFLTSLWEPAMQTEPGLREACMEIETIEKKGYLTRVLLAEYLELGRRLFGEFPTEAVRQETREFVHHLAQLARREVDDESVDLDFKRGELRVGVVLVGNREKALTEGAAPYVKACLFDIKAGYNSIYVLARGARCPLVEEVVGRLRGNGRVLDSDIARYQLEIDGHLVDAVCARIVIDQGEYSPSSRAGMVAIHGKTAFRIEQPTGT